MRHALHAATLAALLLSLPCALSSPASAQGDPSAPGFGLAPRPYDTSPLSATLTLSSLDYVVFDGLVITQHAPDGSLRRRLGELAAFAYPSFLVTDDEEARLFVGESSTGAIWRLEVGFTTTPELVTTLAFNYDAAFHANGLYVSAASCGLTCGNEIWRVELATRQARLVARTPGASGPVACDASGNLFYASASAQFPPPPKPSAVWRWSSAQLAGPDALDLSDALLLGGGFSGAARLACDRRDGALFLLESNFATGENRLRRVLGPAEASPVLVEGRPHSTPGNLSLVPGTTPARLRPHQPEHGGALTWTTTDFVSAPERFELRPRRPLASLSGPGLSGPGAVRLELSSGPPGGFARILYAPRSGYVANEPAYLVGGLPLFVALELASLALWPGWIPLDGSGALQLDFTNPGGLEGRFVLQLAIYDAARRLVATSSAAFL